MMYLRVTLYLVFLLFATLVNCGKTVNHDNASDCHDISFIAECSQPQPLLINRDLSDYKFTAASYADKDHNPEQGSLESDDCWCSTSLNGIGHSPWLQVTFSNVVEVINVSVAGLGHEYIINYNIQYGLNGEQLQYVINNDTGCGKVVHTVKQSQNRHYKPFRFFLEKQVVILKLLDYLLQ